MRTFQSPNVADHHHIAVSMCQVVHRTGRRIRTIGRRFTPYGRPGSNAINGSRPRSRFISTGPALATSSPISSGTVSAPPSSRRRPAREGKLHKFIFQCGSGFLYHRFRRELACWASPGQHWWRRSGYWLPSPAWPCRSLPSRPNNRWCVGHGSGVLFRARFRRGLALGPNMVCKTGAPISKSTRQLDNFSCPIHL